jgi:hypothetical protein
MTAALPAKISRTAAHTFTVVGRNPTVRRPHRMFRN